LGRLIFAIIFFAAFIIFAIAKTAVRGVKAAYGAVFDDGSAQAKQFMSEAFAAMVKFVSDRGRDLDGIRPHLPEAVSEITAIALRLGFQLNSDQVKAIVAKALESIGVAPEYRIRTALDDA